jgi:hypothetical protein
MGEGTVRIGAAEVFAVTVAGLLATLVEVEEEELINAGACTVLGTALIFLLK